MARVSKKGSATALLLHGEERFLVDEKARQTVEEWRADLDSRRHAGPIRFCEQTFGKRCFQIDLLYGVD